MFPKKSFSEVDGGGAGAARSQEDARDDRRVEVAYERLGDAEVLALRYMTWADGLGWCCQKTIRVEEDQLDELHRALTVARHRARRKAADAGAPQAPAQVIQLPSLA
ncbi:MAG TPA: hypothetical protein VE642_00690 [Pyrinomonadaceae bacterium]|jgi:hypothetical protein|nr:hypothetical protein [Pyrinomonadaceae bacterium]